MKKKKNLKLYRKRVAKTFIVVLTLFALITNIVPLPDLSFISEKLSNIKVVRAIDDMDPNPQINSPAMLVKYSKVYQAYPENHQFDNITLSLTGDTGSAFEGFQSIGTVSCPFGGTLTINAISSTTMNLDCAFFDYVYDYAEIITAEGKVIEFATTNSHTNAVFANHVIHDFTATVQYHENGSRGSGDSNQRSNSALKMNKEIIDESAVGEEELEETSSEEGIKADSEKNSEESIDSEKKENAEEQNSEETEADEIIEGESEKNSEEAESEERIADDSEKYSEVDSETEESESSGEQNSEEQNSEEQTAEEMSTEEQGTEEVSEQNDEESNATVEPQITVDEETENTEQNDASVEQESDNVASNMSGSKAPLGLDENNIDESDSDVLFEDNSEKESLIPGESKEEQKIEESSESAEKTSENLSESTEETSEETSESIEETSEEESKSIEETSEEISESIEETSEETSESIKETSEKTTEIEEITSEEEVSEEKTSESPESGSEEKKTEKKKNIKLLEKVIGSLKSGLLEDSAVTPRPTDVYYAHWNIKVVNFGGNVNDHGSLIGIMHKGSKVYVSLNNTSSGAYTSSANTGLICGTVGDKNVEDGEATLIVESVAGSAVSNIAASGTGASAGGFVGELTYKSTLQLSSEQNAIANVVGTITSGDYCAGGIVGYNDRAAVNTGSYSVTITNTISGKEAAGGVFGYYCPQKTDEDDPTASVDYELDIDSLLYQIGSGTSAADRCKVNSSQGSAGGLFGILKNQGGVITVKGTKTVYVSGYGSNFGGLIGKYESTSVSDSLFIQGKSDSVNELFGVDVSRSANLTNFGGLVGLVDDTNPAFISAKYVKVTADSTNQGCFGGVVARCDNAYVYADTFTLSASGYYGGGIVGHTENGVVHLAGKTDFSVAAVDTTNVNYGQIVGYRDAALIFADSSWDFIRNSTTNVSADDIGSWGEIVRFKSTGFVISDVLDNYYISSAQDPKHYVTLKSAPLTNGVISIASKAEFAKAALNMQLNTGTSGGVLRFADEENSCYSELTEKNVVLTADVDLNHTGMTGLTRDNRLSDWSSGIGPEYAGGLLEGNDHTLTLAIGAPYEGTDSTSIDTDETGKGKIYRHRFNGLFGETTNGVFTVQNIVVTGKVHSFSNVEDQFYVGTIAGNVGYSVKAQNVTVDSDTGIIYGSIDKGNIYVGGLAGKITEPGTSIIGSTSYTGNINSIFGANISGRSGSANAYIGGVAGYVGNGGNIKVYDVEITNSIYNRATKNEHKMGGLFGVIASGTNILDINGVELTNLSVKGKMSSKGSMGGLLGYSWNTVTATFNNVKVTGCVLDNDNSTGGNMAGLVYSGSGNWTFNKVEIGETNTNGISFSGGSAASFGMLVNKAGSGDNAMYLKLPSGYTYTIQRITNSGVITSNTVYDEIAACSKMGDKAIEENGNSVISINTRGTTIYGTQTASSINMTSGTCNTYQNQVTLSGFNKYNSNTRYYYNLDSYNPSALARYASQLLLLYSVNQYAHSSIENNFSTNFKSLTQSNTTSFDMEGYSYYPFDVSENIGIQGTVKLYNADIETRENDSVGDNYARTTLRDSGNDTITQHYLMHAGLFRNVSAGITIKGTLKLAGTVPCVDGYSGALVCGNIEGNSSNNAAVVMEEGKSIVLDGIKIHNKNATYSPLLINSISEYADIQLLNIKATSTKYTQDEEIATSLVGNAGSETARSLKITFGGIKLDGRAAGNTTEPGLTTVYGTSHSLFTKATLLESLSYASGTGSSGIYNYTYDEDWGDSRNVTYGYEISDTNSINFGQEIYYYKGFGDSEQYTNPKEDSASVADPQPYSFAGFIPYVYVSGSRITNPSVQHQLDVNHSAATFDGCGTYNHPYTIAFDEEDYSSAEDGGLQTIANIISGTNLPEAGFKIKLPDNLTSTWCSGKNSCKEYEFDGSDSFDYYEGETLKSSKTLAEVTKYLAGAYYSIESDVIYLSQGFQGLGNSTNDDGIFRGVIYGNGNTIENSSDSPLIYASNGSVVYNLKIVSSNTNIMLSGGATDKFASQGGCGAYGAVIGRVFGGDNIIDQVKIDVSGCNISSQTIDTPVGGYIGVIVNGGVFFRNMDQVDAAYKKGFTGSYYAENNYNYLYCNPLIGRVINGFAVNETDGYAPYENGTRTFGDNTSVTGDSVSLHNGNKNYSITDINPDNTKKLSVSGSSIEIPDSQAFFIMSLILNSGMGTNGDSTLASTMGYYGSNHITRHANYSGVGTDRAITETTSPDIIDYLKTANDVPSKPYLIEKYTTTGSDVKKLGTDTFSILLKDNIILPDGYKGIGNLFVNNTKLQLSLTQFDGDDYSVSQNTTFYCYTDDTSKNQDNYLPYTSANGPVHGLGLFNFMSSVSGETTFKDSVLTGNVISRQYHNGKVLDYTISYDYSGLTTGMLIGTLNMLNNATVSDIYLQNVYSESTRDAAGMIGYLTNNGKKLTLNNTAGKTGYDSEKIYVNAGTSAGGLFARQGNEKADHSAGVGDIDIDLNNHFFNYTSIVSRYNGKTVTTTTNANEWNADWTLGVGGLIGVIRANNSSGTNNNISISNIKIGSSNETRTRLVACKYKQSGQTEDTYGCIYSGGLVGIANRAPIVATNCEMYNVSVESGLYAGGVLGWGGTKSDITLNHFTIEDRHGAKIYSSGTSGNAGCVVGFCKAGNDTQSMGSLKLFNSTIKGYDIEAAYAGGVLGDWTASKAFSIINSEVYDCDIKYITAGGGIAGRLQKSLDGYNVRMSGISLTKKGSTQKQGYIVGQKESAATIKIAGFQRIGTISEEKLTGSASDYKMSSLYGSGGYVIFADYDGSSVGGNTTPSGHNFGNVTAVDNLASSPYITINPANTIDANINLVTSDGISINARRNILTDTSKKKYQVAKDKIAYFVNNGEIKTNLVSSFSNELGDVIKGKTYDFPMLVVDDTDSADEVVNNYLGMLTNTTLDFSNSVSNKTYDGTVNGDDKIGVVSIRKCSYANGTFTISNSKDACLTIDSSTNKFVIRKDGTGQEQYDTANASGQFTLIDVAFKAPSETGKAAYHLYVPVYVKKLLEYSFDISAVSGTSYERAIYESDYGNTLVENLGTPVTLEFKYTYFRTAAEWTAEGDDYYYDKKLKFNSTAANFASDTTMVLIDVNDNGKAYYLDTLSTGFNAQTGILDFGTFKDADGNTFTPKKFNALPTNSDGYRTETYYLSIYTNNTAGLIYHYGITSTSLEKTGKPTRRVECNCSSRGEGDTHYVADIIMGDFFDNSVTVTTPQDDTVDMTTKEKINVEVTATVNIKNTAQAIIGDYLYNPKVTIYHSLLLSLEKYNSEGVKTEQGIAYLNQAEIVQHTIQSTGGSADNITNAALTDNSMFVELPTGRNIKEYIKQGKVATIYAEVNLIYNESTRREEEFPYRDTSTEDESGAVVIGYSGISSTASTAAYSPVSVFGRDVKGRRYYCASESEATLSYNASYEVKVGEDKYTIDNQLGINGLEMTPHELAEMHSIGIYDTSKLSRVEGAKYILCEIELYQRESTNSEAYNSTAVNIGNYISRWRVCGDSTAKVVYRHETGNKYYYILDINEVEKDADKVYRIPIDFWVINGSDLENSSLLYGNYKIKLTTTLLKDFDAAEGIQDENLETKSTDSDYVIYTNSKINTDRMH